ncbi:response regulator [Kineococcus gynurae]|uniref:Transcriptional regulatory protein n=1 Tax=Kineococcus gynurae TaxID=452979 RepID=A0ABV5LXK1_9ACTN
MTGPTGRPGIGRELQVLVVDDDFRVAELHARAVARTDGFAVAATAGSRAAARSAVAARRSAGHEPYDLALVDVWLPDGSGIGLLPELGCDAFVLSAATEPPTFRAALRAGALAYLVKPFPEELLQQRLRAYARFRRVLAAQPVLDQDVADAALQALRGEGGSSAARATASSATRDLVLGHLREAGRPCSAAEVAEATGISRATAQRHLAALDAAGRLELQLRYGATGRPEQRYSPRETST